MLRGYDVTARIEESNTRLLPRGATYHSRKILERPRGYVQYDSDTTVVVVGVTVLLGRHVCADVQTADLPS